jgi:hypothetical protein
MAGIEEILNLQPKNGKGKPYQIVDVADIPADRTFRNAWTYTEEN